MTKRNAIILSVSLAIIYAVAMCCFGVFGASVATWFMLWIPTFLKYLGCTAGFALVIALPIRVQYAMEKKRLRIENLIAQRRLAVLEAKQKELDAAAQVAQQVTRYE